MKKSISALLVCSSLLLFGCQNDNNTSKVSDSSNSEESSSVIIEEGSTSPIITKEGATSIPEEVTVNSENSSTVIADDGTVVTIVPEDQRIYLSEDSFMDGTGLYKVTENKEDKMNRKDEIEVEGKNYYLLYIFPNADDDKKVDLYYEEYNKQNL